MPTIELEDFSFEVDDSFLKLSKEEQDKIVEDAVMQDAISGTGRAFAKGLMFGFRDEIVAALTTGSFFRGEEYERARTAERAKEAAFMAREPATAIAAELGGGMLLPGGALATVGRGASLLGRGARAALAGAGAGALFGAGEAEEVADIPREAALAGTIGAVTGPVAAAVPSAVGAIGRPVVRTAGRVAEAAVSDPSKRAARMIASRLRDAGVTGKEMKALMKSAKPETIADLGDASVARLARLVAQSPGEGSDIAAKALNARHFGSEAISSASERIEQDLLRAGAPKQTALQAKDGLRAIKKEKAADLYAKAEAFAPPVEMRNQLAPIFKRLPRNIINQAKSTARLAGRDFSGETYQNIDMAGLNQIQRTLRSMATKAYKEGNGELGGIYADMRKQLLNIVDNYNPDFAKARSMYAGSAAQEAALELGRSFRRFKDAGEIKRLVADMGEDELHNFRVGVAQSIRNEMDRAAPGRNMAAVISGSRQKIQQIEEAFPEGSFEELKRALDAETAMAARRQRILGGSQTAETMMEAGQSAAEEAAMAGQMIRDVRQGGLPSAVAGFAERYGMPAVMGVGPQTSRELGRMLFATEPAARAAAIRQVREAGLAGRILPEAVPYQPGPTRRAAEALSGIVPRGALFQAGQMAGAPLLGPLFEDEERGPVNYSLLGD